MTNPRQSWRAIVGALAFFCMAGDVAVAQKGGWIADARTGCKVWNDDPVREENIDWSGGCENGLAAGKGVLKWFVKGRLANTYSGEYRAGKRNGRGTFSTPEGFRYEGDWRDDLGHGRGVFTWADGNRYEGEVRDSERNGRGIYVWANGTRYEGQWRDGKRNGRGVWTSSSSRYEGEWRDDLEHGQGVVTMKNGDRFEGRFVDGKANGLGTLRHDGGEVDTGMWSNGCLEQNGWRLRIYATREECGYR